MPTQAEEQLAVVNQNLNIARAQTAQLEQDRDILKAQIPTAIPVVGGGKDVAKMLRTVKVSPGVDAREHSLITTDASKVKALRDANPSVPGVYPVNQDEFTEIVESNWGVVVDE